MEYVIKFLIDNPDILQKVKEGTASLLRVTEEEKDAIIASFSEIKLYSYFWR
jgi:competence protein ComX